MGQPDVRHLCLHKYMITISLLIPVYKVEQYIEKCAISLFEQTYSDIEYVFVDDCSPDSSIQCLKSVIEKYPQRSKNIKIIRHERNRGLAAARNTAVECSTGKYLMHVDSDDYLENDAVELLVDEAVRSDADIVVADYYLEFAQHKSELKKYIKPDEKTAYIAALLTKKISPCIWGKLFVSELYKRNNIQSVEGLNHGEDYATIPRLVYYANNISYLPKALYHYVQYNNNAYTKNITQKTIDQMTWADSVLDDFFSKIPEHDLYDKTLILSKLRTKVNLLKRGNRSLFGSINKLYPELTEKYKSLLSAKDRLLIFLVKKHLYTTALIYIHVGFYLLSFRWKK